MSRHREPLRSWLELLRIPNLFTVPGDPLMGFFIAFLMFHETHDPTPLYSFLGLPLVLISSLLFYCFGLVLNDVLDFEDDCFKRPERPLPSGRISVRHAIHAAVLFAVAGLLLAGLCGFKTFLTAILLVLLIILYTKLCKRNNLMGPLAMGLCRGFNFLLGASLVEVVNVYPIICIFLLQTCYIFSVTLISRYEKVRTRFKVYGWLPCFSIAFFYMLFAVLILLSQVKTELYISKLLFFACVLVLVVSSFLTGQYLTHFREPKEIQQTVGKLIRNLIIMQCSILFFCGVYGIVAGIIILTGIIPSMLLSHTYKAS